MTSKGPLLTAHADSNPLVAALREIGQEVIQCDYHQFESLLPGCIGYYGNLFSEIKRPSTFVAMRRALTRQSIPYIFWNRDAPWHVGIKPHYRYLLQAMKPVDLYLAHSIQDAGWFTRGEPHYFPNAARRSYCQATLSPAFAKPELWRYDISFFGAIGNEKRTNCLHRKIFLDTVRSHLEQRGIVTRWRIIDTIHEPLTEVQQLELIRTTRINLNFGAMCDLPGNPSWGMPERVFGIPAAGGFLLTDWRESIPDTFPDDSCDHFRTPSECVEKIIHYLGNPEIMCARGKRLHTEVLAHNTYEVRAKQLMDLLNRFSRVKHVSDKTAEK